MLIFAFRVLFGSETEQRSAQRAGPVRVVVIGHSYVTRLQQFMSASPQLTNLGLTGVEVNCVGVGGATLGNRRSIRRNLCNVATHRPHLIFVHVRENDVARMTN